MDNNGQEISSVKELKEGDIFNVEQGEIVVAWLTRGNGALGIDLYGGIFLLGNDFLYVPEGHSLDVVNLTEKTRLFMLKINIERLITVLKEETSFSKAAIITEDVENKLGKITLIFHWPHTAALMHCFEMLIGDYYSSYDMTEFILLDRIRLMERMLDIEDKGFVPLGNATHTDVVMYVTKSVRENYRTITLKEVAETLHYSPAYLSQILQESLGLNFQQLLDFRRAVVGRTRLLDTNDSLEDIAAQLGFETYTGFYKFWKKRQGMSPKKYREVYAKENVYFDREIRKV